MPLATPRGRHLAAVQLLSDSTDEDDPVSVQWRSFFNARSRLATIRSSTLFSYVLGSSSLGPGSAYRGRHHLAAATAFAATAVYAADTIVMFDPGTVQYGYTDGYWTKSHEWRTWEKSEHVEVYRKYPDDQYYDWVHTRDSNQGWIELKK